MKVAAIVLLAASFSAATAFVAPKIVVERRDLSVTKLEAGSVDNTVTSSSRHDFIQTAVAAVVASAVVVLPDAAVARGRATLEQAYAKYTPRILAGGEFYSTDLKKLVAGADWEGIQNALQEPPARKKEDLTKSDSGVAARARQAGQFSDARVLVAADLFGSAFSESSISPKTKKMQASVVKMRAVVDEMQSITKQALGGGSGGLFGFGAKKVDKVELAKRLRALYVAGGNAYNEYILAANENLALKFDKLPYIK
jgi:hypothetical protein